MTMREEIKLALRLSEQGRPLDAAAAMEAVIADCRRNGEAASLDAHMLRAGFLFNAGDLARSAAALEETVAVFPDEPKVHENLGILHKRLGRFEEALGALEKALSLGDANPNIHDGLCSVYGTLGRMEEARRHGTESLLAKDAEATANGLEFDVPVAPPKPFDPTRPADNIVAFSLWGDRPRYTQGAVQNAILVTALYPGWTARFYVDDTVPPPVVDQLRQLRAEIVMRPRPSVFYEGLLWRLEVVGDPTVSRFLVRDADAVVNTQERAAVDEWLASNRHFHVMRDWFTHTDLILAGLWGGAGGVLPPLDTLRAAFKPFRVATPNFDQDLLRMTVWPTARKSVLVHDGYFDCFDSRPFPATGRLPPGMHVGQDHTHRQIRAPQSQDKRR